MGVDTVDPAAVWRLIERADERMKYASNRDPAEALRQAREALSEASAALATLQDPAARAALSAQIERRRADLNAREAAES